MAFSIAYQNAALNQRRSRPAMRSPWAGLMLPCLLACVTVTAHAAGEQKAPPEGELHQQAPPEHKENLMPNGGFEKAAETGKHPAHWQAVDNLVWHWTESSADEKRGKVIRINTDVKQGQAFDWWVDRFIEGKPLSAAPEPKAGTGEKYGTIGGLEGGFYWSDFIKVEPGGAYRVYIDAKGPPAKVFIRGYEDKVPLSFADEHPSVQQMMRKARGKEMTDEDGRPIQHRLRYRYTTWFPVGGSDKWQTYTHQKPRHPNSRKITEDVRFIRIMIYPYWPPATYWFDDVRVYEVEPAASAGKPDATEEEIDTGKVVE